MMNIILQKKVKALSFRKNKSISQLIIYMQIPIVSSAEAAELASKYYKEGFKTLKLKVGKNLKADIEVLQAIRAAHPECQFILDANEGYNSDEAVEVLEKLHG
jgi:L-alanine-DL-glutamate epimerase-like enolase superfamily enzyme